MRALKGTTLKRTCSHYRACLDFHDTNFKVFKVLSGAECPPLWMGNAAKVSFYSTVDEFKAVRDLAVKDKHCMRRRDCRVPLTECFSYDLEKRFP